MTKINELLNDICADAAVSHGIAALLLMDAVPADHSAQDAQNLDGLLDRIILRAAQAKEQLKPFIIRRPRPSGEHLI